MKNALREWRRRFGLWRCRRGHHLALEWASVKQRPIGLPGVSHEMWYVSFGYAWAKWNGWCPRCGKPIEWSSEKPEHLRGSLRGRSTRQEQKP